MRKFATILFSCLLWTHDACLAAELEIEAVAEPPSGPALAKTEGEEISNITWFFYTEPQGDRRLIRRDVGVGVRLQQDGRASSFTIKLANLSPVSSQDALNASVVFTLAKSAGDGMAEPPLLRASGRLPEELRAGDYLVLRFPAVELKGDVDYVAILEFAESAPTRKVQLAVAPVEQEARISSILRATDEMAAPELVWKTLKAPLLFILGGEYQGP